MHPLPENPPEIVLIFPWIGTSCPWSPVGAADVGAPCGSCRYSFKKPFLTSSSNWNPNAKQLCRLWPKAWWNSHQESLLGPSLLLVFGGDFSMFATLGMAISSLRSIRKLCLVGRFPSHMPWFEASLLHMAATSPGLSSLSWPHVPLGGEDDQFLEVGLGRCFPASLWTHPLQRCGLRLCGESHSTYLGDTLSANHWKVLAAPLVWRRVPSYLHLWCAASPPMPRTCSRSPSKALPGTALRRKYCKRQKGEPSWRCIALWIMLRTFPRMYS